MTAGKPVASISASTWNRFGDATRRIEEAAQLGGDGRTEPRVEARYVMLANATGAARDAYQIVHYDEHGQADWPADNATFPLRAVPPANAKAPSANDRFAILTNKVESGTANVVRAQVAGLAYVLVDVKDAADDTCGPVDDQYTHLDSGTGSTPILAKALAGEVTETGVQWCVVLLGGKGNVSLASQFAVVSSALAAGSKSGSAAGEDYKFTPGAIGAAIILDWVWGGSAWTLEVPADPEPIECVGGYSEVAIPVDAFVTIDFGGTVSPGYEINSGNSPPVATFVEIADYLRALADYAVGEDQVMYHAADDSEIVWGGEECT